MEELSFKVWYSHGVDSISDHRATDRGEMDSNLMSTPRPGNCLYKGVILKGLYHTVGCMRFSSTGNYCHLFTIFRVTTDRGSYIAFLWRGTTPDQSHVFL